MIEMEQEEQEENMTLERELQRKLWERKKLREMEAVKEGGGDDDTSGGEKQGV